MNIKQIKELVMSSYKNDSLDEEQVEKIANYLNRSELKQYIKEIKLTENKKNIIVTIPYLPGIKDQEKLQLLFPKRKIIYIINPSILVGLTIRDNDLISEMNLQNNFIRLKKYLNQDYD